MVKDKITEIARKIALPIVNLLGIELVDVEYVKEGSNWYLRFYIYKKDGITIEDCETVSKQLSRCLDEIDPIPQSYFLEVSSPGLDRPLKNEQDFRRNIGELVKVKLYEPLDGSKTVEGILADYNKNEIILEVKLGNKLVLELKRVAVVKRILNF